MEHSIKEAKEKIVNPEDGTIAPFMVNRIIDHSQVDINPFDGQYLEAYQKLAGNPKTKVVSMIKAFKDCIDLNICPDKIQEAYNNGERKRKSFLDKTK